MSDKNRTWNYRVIEFVTPGGEPWRSIHEVHYVDEVPIAYSESPACIVWDVDEGYSAALFTLKRMRKALDKPVLVEADFKEGV